VAKVEKQHPKNMVCQIRFDGEWEYGSQEEFLEYLAEEEITREVSAPYSQQQNGLSERCNRCHGSSTINAQAYGNPEQTLGQSRIHGGIHQEWNTHQSLSKFDPIREMESEEA
jgi:hypothetical protein